ncbi:phosphoglycerate mutase, 2,3-bisphosphoglycerate- independent [Halorhabdus utahensis DSM 12940]|uniref:2,3-bisphosphoglycerate-independent phosphoglycerate mutase n=1 Tax=Halorhabdus utahensis (strain DSM 12940 / JCM 11049 / AX-2) TaxID=519442 RepID=C7NQ18_HALUD|nr:2,3-bisphosphoglycerate-independent phosphoglycerate mutase [Halorhabdus utahensis]ACV11762.1 phosphoglycerate mutase, 2,3-bisphosphoglycerate- independent [Halorhabdus utahensis DSM 12940]
MQAGLIILDGWGLNDDEDARDAVKAADTPNFDAYWDAGAHNRLDASGRRVGLPEGQMGNSEVGHLNIGAGRVVKQDTTRITDDIEDGTFFENENLLAAMDYAKDNDGQVHFMGLVSDGGVHSRQTHLHALIEMAADNDVEAVTHAFMDGRDTSPTGGADYLRELQGVIDEEGTGDVATVTGRYHAMDRDQNWERTKKAYDAIVHREAEFEAPDPVTATEESYDRDTTDEFIEPTLIEGGAALEDGDAVIFFNFRSDRARQLTRLLNSIDPDWDFDTSPPETHYVTMTQYDETFDLPVAYPPNQPANTLGEVVSAAGGTQLRLAESEKYPHVTYFLNGGREVKFDGELREIVESPDVPTYDEQPEMSAAGVTDTAIQFIESESQSDPEQSSGDQPRDSDDPDLLVLNYANPDMVGHTGDFDATVAAVEAVDEQLGRLIDAVQTAGADVLITADHGNADDLGTVEDPHTAHTLNDVPIVYLTSEGDEGGRSVRSGGSLCDIAPTLLELLDVEKPAEMTGESLLE